MDICHHCNIVHDENECPLCEAQERIETLEEQLDDSHDEIKELEKRIEELE